MEVYTDSEIVNNQKLSTRNPAKFCVTNIYFYDYSNTIRQPKLILNFKQIF